jgi:hypothetical protein
VGVFSFAETVEQTILCNRQSDEVISARQKKR